MKEVQAIRKFLVKHEDILKLSQLEKNAGLHGCTLHRIKTGKRKRLKPSQLQPLQRELSKWGYLPLR